MKGIEKCMHCAKYLDCLKPLPHILCSDFENKSVYRMHKIKESSQLKFKKRKVYA